MSANIHLQSQRSCMLRRFPSSHSCNLWPYRMRSILGWGHVKRRTGINPLILHRWGLLHSLHWWIIVPTLPDDGWGVLAIRNLLYLNTVSSPFILPTMARVPLKVFRLPTIDAHIGPSLRLRPWSGPIPVLWTSLPASILCWTHFLWLGPYGHTWNLCSFGELLHSASSTSLLQGQLLFLWPFIT